MAILPRCYTSGFSNSNQYNLPLTGWTNAGAGVSGTAPVAGDLVVATLMDNTNGGTVSQIAGSPFTAINGPTGQPNAGSFWAVPTYRQWTGGESTPQWQWTSGSRLAWVVTAFAPDSGMMLLIDAIATEKVDSTPATSHQANSAVASATDTSVVLAFISAGSQSTTAITVTAPSGWTQIALANNIGTSGQYVDAAAMWYRASQTGTVAPGSQTFTGSGNTNAVLDHVLIREVPVIAQPDAAGAVESMISGQPTSFPELGTAVDTFTGAPTPPYADVGAVGDESLSVAVAEALPITEAAGASDGLLVFHQPPPAPITSAAARPASPAFIVSQMPRMHLQNLLTGQWLHRDVQGVSSPSITWQLNTADTFSCSVGPPRGDLLDTTGNPVFRIWRDACYLEESDEIKFGGILTSVQGNGPLLQLGFTGFAGYANGIPYEGATYKVTRTDALDVVRYLWKWVQDQPNGNIGLELDSTKSGVLLGAIVQAGATSTLLGDSKAGSTVIKVHDANPFNPKMIVSISGGSSHTVKSTSPSSKTITLTTPTANFHKDGETIAQVVAPTPFELDWWNSTDVGQEVGSIQQEAIFDWYERHTWTDAAKTAVRHKMLFGVPRVGSRRADLRFAEGENIIAPATVNYDGTTFANNVIGLGAGQGSAQIRKTVGINDSRLRRVIVYTDQTVKTDARMQSKAQRVLASVEPTEAVTSITVINHPNAPFGHFGPGDDIPVLLASNWNSRLVWSRITQMQQDPTTNLMNLTLARSDSFTYMAQSGQAGTM